MELQLSEITASSGSYVWNHFTKDPDYKNNKKANCNYYHKTYICSTSTTSEISKHLKKFHATKLLTEAKIPSADTIKNKIMTYYEEDKVKMKALLKNLPEWKLQNIIIDFIQTQDSHTGSNIKDAFLLGISNMSLKSKIRIVHFGKILNCQMLDKIWSDLSRSVPKN
ncbi:hypothetical protein C1646_800108 [Rhizophagus diaphanus]|nr:hypothetical protein C1646_800108 [Rhizophagus diaphanus] [Rhizophagus sp. MUCL 43196]